MDNYAVNLIIFSSGILSFFLVFLSVPTILRVAHSKNLFDEPNLRTVHKYKIPTLGGLAIFIGFIFTYSLYVDWFQWPHIPFLIPALFIIFAIGIKDDILITAPMVKLFGQVLAALIIVGFGDVRITDFHGLFAIEPNEIASAVITILVFIFIVNGFNLIDGVDGLAAITGIITLSAFSFWFYLNGNFHMPILCTALIGGLLAFIYFNVFSETQKIFMGDTGSLLLGFVIALVAIKFSEFNKIQFSQSHIITMTSAPSVVVGILIVPIIDTIRVFFLRISRGRSPFTADKNHIHHRLLTLGFSHLQISLLIGGINIGFIIISFLLRDIGTIKLLLINISLGLIIAHLPSLAVQSRKKKKLQKRDQPV